MLVFWRDPSRVKGYASEYVRRHRGRLEDTDPDETEQMDETAVSAG